jgi:hypothetical protein
LDHVEENEDEDEDERQQDVDEEDGDIHVDIRVDEDGKEEEKEKGDNASIISCALLSRTLTFSLTLGNHVNQFLPSVSSVFSIRNTNAITTVIPWNC